MLAPSQDAEGLSGFVFMSTAKGMVKKTEFASYKNIRATGIIAMQVKDDDELIGVEWTSGEDDILIATNAGQLIRFKENDIRPTARNTQGVRGIRLKDGQLSVTMVVVNSPDQVILTLSQNGFGKATPIADISCIKRGGQGVRGMKIGTKTGQIVGALSYNSQGGEVLLLTDLGTLVRIDTKQVPVLGRNTQGVRLMRVGAKENVVAISLLPEDQEIPEKQ